MYYAFQVGTGTGIMTHYFNLFVIVPMAVISGNDEYHIGEGSSITLLCKIENVSTYPQNIPTQRLCVTAVFAIAVCQFPLFVARLSTLEYGRVLWWRYRERRFRCVVFNRRFYFRVPGSGLKNHSNGPSVGVSRFFRGRASKEKTTSVFSLMTSWTRWIDRSL